MAKLVIALAFIAGYFAIGSAQPDQAWRDEMLAQHNSRRAKHGLPALTWNRDAEDFADNWAASMKRKYSFNHSPRASRKPKNFGENLAGGSDPKQAMKMWYDDEITKYNFNRQGFSMSTGHFTQVVWRDTTSVGCSFRKQCFKYQRWEQDCLVCTYHKAGNMQGQFEKNVNRPL